MKMNSSKYLNLAHFEAENHHSNFKSQSHPNNNNNNNTRTLLQSSSNSRNTNNFILDHLNTSLIDTLHNRPCVPNQNQTNADNNDAQYRNNNNQNFEIYRKSPSSASLFNRSTPLSKYSSSNYFNTALNLKRSNTNYDSFFSSNLNSNYYSNQQTESAESPALKTFDSSKYPNSNQLPAPKNQNQNQVQNPFDEMYYFGHNIARLNGDNALWKTKSYDVQSQSNVYGKYTSAAESHPLNSGTRSQSSSSTSLNDLRGKSYYRRESTECLTTNEPKLLNRSSGSKVQLISHFDSSRTAKTSPLYEPPSELEYYKPKLNRHSSATCLDINRPTSSKKATDEPTLNAENRRDILNKLYRVYSKSKKTNNNLISFNVIGEPSQMNKSSSNVAIERPKTCTISAKGKRKNAETANQQQHQRSVTSAVLTGPSEHQSSFNSLFLKYTQRRFESNKKLIENLNKEFKNKMSLKGAGGKKTEPHEETQVVKAASNNGKMQLPVINVHESVRVITNGRNVDAEQRITDHASEKSNDTFENLLSSVSSTTSSSKKRVSFHEHVLETDVDSGNSRLKPILNH